MLPAEKKEEAKYTRKRKQPRTRKPKCELTGAEFNEVLRRSREQDVSEESRDLTAEKKEGAKASRKRKQPREQTDAEFNEVLRRAREQDITEKSREEILRGAREKNDPTFTEEFILDYKSRDPAHVLVLTLDSDPPKYVYRKRVQTKSIPSDALIVE